MQKKGFSLIEVVASFAIVGISMVALVKMLSLANANTTLNQKRVVAANLLQRKIEEIKCKSFGKDVTESNFSYTGFPDYRLSVTESVNYLSLADLKRVDVAINWATAIGISHQEAISTLIANH